jgi:hypothetical protein
MLITIGIDKQDFKKDKNKSVANFCNEHFAEVKGPISNTFGSIFLPPLQSKNDEACKTTTYRPFDFEWEAYGDIFYIYPPIT